MTAKKVWKDITLRIKFIKRVNLSWVWARIGKFWSKKLITKSIN